METYKKCKLKRIKHACCGMEDNKTYEGEICIGGFYGRVLLPNGEWTTYHAFNGFFEIVEDNENVSPPF